MEPITARVRVSGLASTSVMTRHVRWREEGAAWTEDGRGDGCFVSYCYENTAAMPSMALIKGADRLDYMGELRD